MCYFLNRYVFELESAGHRLPVVSPAQSSGHFPPNRPGSGQLYLHQIPVSGAQLSSTFIVVQKGAAQELKLVAFLVLSVLPALKIDVMFTLDIYQ